MSRMTKFDRARAIGLLQSGLSMAKVARQMKVAKSSISRLASKVRKVGNERALKNLPGQGRKPKASLGDWKRIVRMVKKNPFITALKIKEKLKLDLSVRYIQNMLHENGYPARKAAKKPLLTPAMIDKRLKFAQDHLDWTEDDWMKVMFSDESTFRLIRGTQKTVRRPSGSNRYSQEFCVKTVKHPGSVMVWGSFDGTYGRAGIRFLPKDKTMNTEEYLATLEANMLPWYESRNNSHFLQDGAPCHKSKRSLNWFQERGIPLISWPGNSPDLNPIENMWDLMKNKLEQKEAKSVEDMKNIIIDIWVKEITPEYCEKLARSMPRRLQSVLDNNGGHTKY